MPTLVLVRHAKAEPHRNEDHSRVLAPKGREQCAGVRAWLTEQGIVPDRVVVSSAARARETWELSGVGTVEPEYDDAVFGADLDDLREIVGLTDASVQTLVLVGHNPTFEDFAHALDDSDRARELTKQGMPTAGVAVFELEEWSSSYGRLVAWRGR